ncbi:MAG: hypothetical protein KGL02_06005 [Acidobacteriota bacterium]|nr:hypothetical protein [Acidobacteriota bacterium]
MNLRYAALALMAIFAIAGGCSKSGRVATTDNAAPADATAAPQSGSPGAVSPSDAAGIRAAIEDHLRGNHGLNMDAMDMAVDSVAINGDQAQAHASFHVKNGGATGMTMQYFLERHANGWIVTNGQPADGNMQLPPGHPGANSTQAAPSVPDVESFFKDHPASKSN